MEPEILPNQLVKRLWLLAIAFGLITFLGGLFWVSSPGGPGLDVVWGVAAVGLGVIAFNIAFFILCSIFAPGISDLVEDDTEVQGDDVVHVVRHAETGDEKTDFYIRNYATARGVTAVAIVSGVMIAAALVFF